VRGFLVRVGAGLEEEVDYREVIAANGKG